jgi:transposase
MARPARRPPGHPLAPTGRPARGASFLVAVTMAVELGDLRRFDNPRQLMAFLGLVPRERSTGDPVRRAGLTLTGNRHASRVFGISDGATTVQSRPSSRIWPVQPVAGRPAS